MAKSPSRKKFLDQSDTLKLAASIAETREQKAQITIQKHHQHTQSPIQGLPKTQKLSPSKTKLKEIKAQIASDKARLKKTKAQLRKKADAAASAPVEKTTSPAPKKRVSFA
ncbi:hypothetical protein BT96DRAFT_913651 [Gymnopus androsaceus JB14]|uniref:Uncharacterized protein n=1 Tax=Gymnopus androsaceus JB14 TaxID=1447944 RepID=A0A6A4IKE4_9AGAR|nr:hypothetical protein BT96DRAFT_913651 [Gymnopus androsaceus JB14]